MLVCLYVRKEKCSVRNPYSIRQNLLNVTAHTLLLTFYVIFKEVKQLPCAQAAPCPIPTLKGSEIPKKYTFHKITEQSET
ncbi:unnamed protein product [Caenorhabditis nigoni]